MSYCALFLKIIKLSGNQNFWKSKTGSRIASSSSRLQLRPPLLMPAVDLVSTANLWNPVSAASLLFRLSVCFAFYVYFCLSVCVFDSLCVFCPSVHVLSFCVCFRLSVCVLSFSVCFGLSVHVFSSFCACFVLLFLFFSFCVYFRLSARVLCTMKSVFCFNKHLLCFFSCYLCFAPLQCSHQDFASWGPRAH